MPGNFDKIFSFGKKETPKVSAEALSRLYKTDEEVAAILKPSLEKISWIHTQAEGPGDGFTKEDTLLIDNEKVKIIKNLSMLRVEIDEETLNDFLKLFETTETV